VKRSTSFYVSALIQLIVACGMARRWLLGVDDAPPLLAVVFALAGILVAIGGYAVRNSPARSDPRALRRIGWVGGVAGATALVALLWRVHGHWILLGESTNLVLALVCIFGLGWALFAVLLLKEQ